MKISFSDFSLKIKILATQSGVRMRSRLRAGRMLTVTSPRPLQESSLPESCLCPRGWAAEKGSEVQRG